MVCSLIRSSNFFALLGGQLAGILKPEPAGFLEAGLGLRFSLAHGVHGLVDELHEVEAFKGELVVGQVFCGALLEGW